MYSSSLKKISRGMLITGWAPYSCSRTKAPMQDERKREGGACNGTIYIYIYILYIYIYIYYTHTHTYTYIYTYIYIYYIYVCMYVYMCYMQVFTGVVLEEEIEKERGGNKLRNALTVSSARPLVPFLCLPERCARRQTSRCWGVQNERERGKAQNNR